MLLRKARAFCSKPLLCGSCIVSPMKCHDPIAPSGHFPLRGKQSLGAPLGELAAKRPEGECSRNMPAISHQTARTAFSYSPIGPSAHFPLRGKQSLGAPLGELSAKPTEGGRLCASGTGSSSIATALQSQLGRACRTLSFPVATPVTTVHLVETSSLAEEALTMVISLSSLTSFKQLQP